MLRLNPLQVIVAFTITLLFCLATVNGQSAIIPLETSQQIDRDLKTKEEHVYQFTLAAGEHARVELKSGKARFNLSLLSKNNELITAISDADSPDLKRLDIVSEKAAQFFIRVAPERSQTSTAKYQLTFTDLRPATSVDRERFALHILDWEVVSLYRQQEKSALQQASDNACAAAIRWKALGEPERAGRMLDRAGRSLYLLSQHQASRVAYENAITAFHQAGAKLAEATSLNNLATQSYNSGDYPRMLSSGLGALMIWQTAHDEDGLRLSRFQQAYAYNQFGEWQKAEDLCRQLLTEVGVGRLDEWDRVYREDVLMVRGMAAVSRGEARLGLNYLEEALALTRQAHNLIVELQLLQHLSLAWQKLGDQARALDYLQQSLAESKRLGLREGESDSFYKLGQLYISLGRRNDARTAFLESVKAAAQGGKRYLSLALMGLARFQHEQGEQAAALTNIEQSLTIIEDLITLIPLDSIRASFHAQEREAWALRTDLLVHLHERNPKAGYDATALQGSESARSRSLLQLLSEKHLLPTETVDATLTARANELRQQIAASTSEKVRLLKNPAASARLAEIENERNLLTQELDRVAVALRTQNQHSVTMAMLTC